MSATCHRTIGVSGDRSCPELATWLHCVDCPVFAAGARDLLAAPAPEGYVAEWTAALARPKPAPEVAGRSVLVFRVGTEWLGVPTVSCVELAEARPARRIAHRTRGNLAGLVNIRGSVLLCVSLRGVLGLDAGPPTPRAVPRLVVLAGTTAPATSASMPTPPWVFLADEVHGVVSYSDAEVTAPPATLPPGLDPFVHGLAVTPERTVGLLRTDRLFAAFDRCLDE